MSELLSLEHVGIGYDYPNIVTDIRLSIHANQRIALVGQNGAGKSTLLQAIMGLIPKVVGDISVDGNNINPYIQQQQTHKIADLGIALVPQQHAIFADLTVFEHFLTIHKRSADCDTRPVRHTLLEYYLKDFPELIPKANNVGKELSGGQRQQLAIALALATKPKLLLLDEPSANIQPSIVESMIDSLRTISDDRGMSLLIAEQNLLVIQELTEQSYVIQAGTLKKIEL